MNDYITKPIDRRRLVATLRRWLPARPADPKLGIVPHVPPEVPPAPAESVANTDSRVEAVPVLEGVDVIDTLRRLEIDRATLERMLLRFADGQQETLDALRSAVIAGDGAMAARHAHAIAGAAGNLGADGLRAAAKTLEQAGRAGRSDLADLLAVVEERATVVLRSIETLRPPADREADAALSPFDPAAAGAALDRLTAALDNYDVSGASGALVELGKSSLPPWAADDLRRLRGCVDGYEYDEARGIASRLLTRVHGSAA
jgi:two-component system, sensor histidine kinase and response regulator